MPLGKNSIKRAANNGYSNVKNAAPDMENSEVLETKTEAVLTSTPKKATRKTCVKEPVIAPTETKEIIPPVEKSAPKKKPTAKKTAKKTESVDGFKRVSFGEEMPYYLL